jgi:hypothetical protein
MSNSIGNGNSGSGAQGSEPGFFGRIFNFFFGHSADHQSHEHRSLDHSQDYVAFNSDNKLVEDRPQVLPQDLAPHVPDHFLQKTGLIFMGSQEKDAFTIHDDKLISTNNVPHCQDNEIIPANQNNFSFNDHMADKISPLQGNNDDILSGMLVANSDEGKIISAHSFSNVEPTVRDIHIANDLGHNVVLDASDILNMGNNLIITGHELDCVNFQDEGWAKIDDWNHLPSGIEPREGYNTYMHESGAIVQIESVIHTNFDPNGSY